MSQNFWNVIRTYLSWLWLSICSSAPLAKLISCLTFVFSNLEFGMCNYYYVFWCECIYTKHTCTYKWNTHGSYTCTDTKAESKLRSYLTPICLWAICVCMCVCLCNEMVGNKNRLLLLFLSNIKFQKDSLLALVYTRPLYTLGNTGRTCWHCWCFTVLILNTVLQKHVTNAKTKQNIYNYQYIEKHANI